MPQSCKMQVLVHVVLRVGVVLQCAAGLVRLMWVGCWGGSAALLRRRRVAWGRATTLALHALCIVIMSRCA